MDELLTTHRPNVWFPLYATAFQASNAMRVKHTSSDMPKPILDAPVDDVLRVTLNSPPPQEWRYLEKRRAAIAKRKREAQG